MKSFTNKSVLGILTILLVFGATNLVAQPRIGGELRVVAGPGAGQTTVEVWVNAVNGADWWMGPGTLQFSYNNTALTMAASPLPNTDYTKPASIPPFYTQWFISRPQADVVSFNIFMDPGFDGTFGLRITPTLQKLIDIHFTNGPQPLETSALNFAWTKCEHSGLLDVAVAPPRVDWTGPEDCSAMAGAALPVELTGLDVVTADRSATLNWGTATEDNNAGFDVEYARAGSEFIQAGFVDGNGSTTEVSEYSYTVEDLLPGKYNFRLKQIDFDGQFEYSDVVEANVSIPGKYILDNAYPNPFNPQTTVNFAVAEEQEVRYELYDATGRLVKTLFSGIVEASETQTLRIDASDLTSGIYIGVLIGQGFNTSQRLVLVK